MNVRTIIIGAFALAAGPSMAEGYGDHHGVTIFTERPCGDALAALDGDTARPITERLAAQGMAWGFLLGYDTARGGLDRDGQTTLELFRAACQRSPRLTGKAILDDLKG